MGIEIWLFSCSAENLIYIYIVYTDEPQTIKAMVSCTPTLF